MSSGGKIATWVAISVAAILLIIFGVRRLRDRRGPVTIVGTVIKHNADTRKESPIADVEITSPSGLAIAKTKSDFSGYFKVQLPPGTYLGDPITLRFTHPDYQPVDFKTSVSNLLYVVTMNQIHGEVESALNETETKVANVLVRYTTEITTTENIGTGVKTFQVVNSGNVSCNQRAPCSPDGKWKATIGSESLDAGDGNVFQNARVSCIAGPCPFTKVVSDDFAHAARTIKVSVLNWSDTTTFLLQAEVFHTQVRDIVRKSYPIIFGRSLNFSVPANVQGVTMEAEINGAQVIFPLASAPALSWADCKVRIDESQARDYRCELKPGYGFR